jgi:RNA polymerase sigma-70 factor (ECF subfamily)
MIVSATAVANVPFNVPPNMDETSLSLLDGLRGNPDDAAWRRLHDLYAPLIRKWLLQRSMIPQDADDVVQEVLLIVVRKLPQFRREPRTGAFRRWLLNITINSLREFWRSRKGAAAASPEHEAMLAELEDSDGNLSRQWDAEHDRHVTQMLLERIRGDFEPRTWQAFEMVALQGVPAAEAAGRLGLTTNAVFIAKSRVLTRLRQIGAGLLD